MRLLNSEMPKITDSLREFINVAGLTAKIKSLEAELSILKNLQASLVGGKARGRKPGFKVAKAQATKTKGKRTSRGKRGALGEDILKFLSPKGKAGAHVKEIAAHVGKPPVNVTAWIYTTGKTKVKKVKPATFAVK